MAMVAVKGKAIHSSASGLNFLITIDPRVLLHKLHQSVVA
jgi:hypothetical protein